MSNERKETIADIVSEMRIGVVADGWMEQTLREFADRIEAAWKLEREAGAEAAQICGEIGEMVGREASKNQSVTNCNRLGNSAALREALEKVRFYLPHFLQYMRLHREDSEAGGYYESILEIVNAAISSPPRNCDVGTAEEQEERFTKFCGSQDCKRTCPLSDEYDSYRCEFAWGHMPYEGGDEKRSQEVCEGGAK